MLDFIINLLFGPGPQFLADGTPILHGWVLPAIMGASALGNWWMGSQAQDKADKRQDRALQLGERRYAETEPLRDMAFQSLQALPQQGPDLSGAFADPSNPFFRPVQPVAPPTQAQPQAPSAPPVLPSRGGGRLR